MNGWRCGVDDEGAVAGEGIAAGKCGECEGGVIASGVLDGGAVESERGGGFVVEVGGGIAVLDGVGEGECVGAGARGIGDGLVCRTGFKGELGSAASGVDGDGLREEDVDGDDVAGFVGAISGGTADGLNGWSGGISDRDGNGLPRINAAPIN